MRPSRNTITWTILICIIICGFILITPPATAQDTGGDAGDASAAPSESGADTGPAADTGDYSYEPGDTDDTTWETGGQPGMEGDTAPTTEGETAMTDSEAQELTRTVAHPRDSIITGRFPRGLAPHLKRYGYDFFRRSPQKPELVPVPPHYVVKPGDNVRVTMWGVQNGSWNLTVGRNGDLNLPLAGAIGAAGMTFSQLQEAVRKAYSRYYTDFELNVTMGRLQGMTVYVVGDARRPGAYRVSSMATLVNALIASGGPAYTGSLRDIQVRRGKRVITRFDAYRFLLEGEKSNDIRLQEGDVVFIPPVQTLCAVTGDVKRPAVYEFTETPKLLDLVETAGGFTSQYYAGRYQVYRIEDHRYRSFLESHLQRIGPESANNIPLNDGDLVRIFSVHEQRAQVRLTGAVARPGEYAIEEGATRLAEVLERAGGLTSQAAYEGEITRTVITQQGPDRNIMMVNYRNALQGGSENLLLKPDDVIQVRTVPEWEERKYVRVTGEVRFPGTYTLRENERISDLLERVGGFTQEAFLEGAQFTRSSVRTQQKKQLRNLADRMERELYVSASTEGDAGAAEVREERLRRERFVQSLRQMQPEGRVVVHLEENPRMLKGSNYDLLLEGGDRLHVPQEPNTVTVMGAVFSPTAFVYRPERTFRHYVDAAGGYLSTADRARTYVVHPDGSAQRAYKGRRPIIAQEGDTIIVPDKLDPLKNIRHTKDVVDIIYKIAVSLSAVSNVLD